MHMSHIKYLNACNPETKHCTFYIMLDLVHSDDIQNKVMKISGIVSITKGNNTYS